VQSTQSDAQRNTPRSEVHSHSLWWVNALSQTGWAGVTERAKGCELGFCQLNCGNAALLTANLTGVHGVFYARTERDQSSLSVTSSYSGIRMTITAAGP
jgi:hypothetical protein